MIAFLYIGCLPCPAGSKIHIPRPEPWTSCIWLPLLLLPLLILFTRCKISLTYIAFCGKKKDRHMNITRQTRNILGYYTRDLIQLTQIGQQIAGLWSIRRSDRV
jgi:hypothetical protein